jgi:hypothetical protein
MKELLKGFAITHDENLVMIEGKKKLAMAYATHLLHVYDHFAWRWTVDPGNEGGRKPETKPDHWLRWYFNAQGKIKTA